MLIDISLLAVACIFAAGGIIFLILSRVAGIKNSQDGVKTTFFGKVFLLIAVICIGLVLFC